MRMKKILSLLMLALISLGTAWAATESSGNTGTNNTTWVGTSMSLDGKYIAGNGGNKQGDMPDKGVKLRSNQGNLVFTVNSGYKVTSFKFYASANTNSSTATIESATVDGGENLLTESIEIPLKGGTTSANVLLTDITAKENITLTFAEGYGAQIVGTWQIEYIQEEVIVQEINAVSLNGTAISAEDLATLKSDKSLTIDGSGLNGLGALDVTLSSGATTVTRTITGEDAAYTFTINGSDEYTVNVTNVAKTYAAEAGSVVYYSKDGDKVSGADSKAVTANGITFAMADESKTFQYGSGSVTLGDVKYVPLKLSTGSAVNVTFPEGKVATKAIVYGWSANGNGKLAQIKESAESEKSVDSSSDIFYATNTAADTYPSVYEYPLDNWESFYFTAAGSASQPFVVIDFVLADKPAATSLDITFDDSSITDGTMYYATVSSDKALDFTGIEGITAYVGKKANGAYGDLESLKLTAVEKVPANTGLVVIADNAKTYTIPFAEGDVEAVDNDLAVAATDIDLYEAITTTGSYNDWVSGPSLLVKTEVMDIDESYNFVYKDAVGFKPATKPAEAGTSFIKAGEVYLPLDATTETSYSGYFASGFCCVLKIAGSTIENIAALKEQSGDAVTLTLSNTKLTYVSTSGTAVIEDETGATPVTGASDLALYAGYSFNGTLGLEAGYGYYNIADYSGMTLASYEVAEPMSITESNLYDYISNYDWRYVTFKNAAYTAGDGSTTASKIAIAELGDTEVELQDLLYTGVELPAEDCNVDIVGFLFNYDLSAYGGSIETYFQPVSITVKAPETVAVEVGSAGYATFSSDKALDFSASGIKAYVATVSGNDITFTRVDKVPAGTGVLLYADGGATEDVPVAAEAAAVENAFVAVTADMNGTALQAAGAYILANGANGIGFYKAGAGASLKAGKAYLKAGASARIIMPNGEVTAIKGIDAENGEATIFNLQGQRVAAPVKGLNIVNGKKAIVK